MTTMHSAIITLGSNLPCRADILRDTIARLRAVVTVEASSGIYDADDDTGRGPVYANEVLAVATSLPMEAMAQYARGLEAAAGRTAESKAMALMPLDIDIVVWDDTIVKPYDITRHYFTRGYAAIRNAIKHSVI